MKRVLLSAYACDPTRGSEPGYGWNWAAGLADAGLDVHCITRATFRAGIETAKIPPNLEFSFIRLPFGLEKLYTASQPTQYLYYILWQWKAYKTAAKLHKADSFDIVHHVTFGSLQLGSFMYRLGVPLVFGPAGGGQMAPAAFKDYFGDAWSAEEMRRKISRLLVRFSPACKTMMRKASVVLVSNEETLRLAESHGARRTELMLDVGLAEWFFPRGGRNRVPQKGRLKLLWVGRLMPRKGILLLLDVMKELKEFPGITLTIVGDGVLKNLLLDTIREYELEDTVDWKGWVPYEKVRDFYGAHDVFLFTSLRESGGVQLVEAMAFGMPVVALDMHGPGLIVDEDRGFKCECDTPSIAIENMKLAILALLRNPELIVKLGTGASTFAASLRWETKIGQVVDKFYG